MVEEVVALVKDLQAVFGDLVGDDPALRQGDGHLPVAYADLELLQVHSRLDNAVIGDNEALGGEGDLPAVEIHLVFKAAHVGVIVGDGDQLLYGPQPRGQKIAGDLGLRRLTGLAQAAQEGGQHRAAYQQQGQQNQQDFHF